MKVNGNRMIRNTQAGAETQRESQKEEVGSDPAKIALEASLSFQYHRGVWIKFFTFAVGP
jgi:hypothetical protein